MYSVMTIVSHILYCCTIYGKVVTRVNPKSSHHKEKNIFLLFFCFLFLLHVYEKMDVS